jgi:hypothetical protein
MANKPQEFPIFSPPDKKTIKGLSLKFNMLFYVAKRKNKEQFNNNTTSYG